MAKAAKNNVKQSKAVKMARRHHSGGMARNRSSWHGMAA